MMQSILAFLLDFLKTPAILIGLITLLGLLLQKKPFSDLVSGTLKATLGFIVLQGGAGLIVKSLEMFGTMFDDAFGIQGIIPNNEAISSIAMEKLGETTALIMVFGMVMNIVFARFTKMKFIFLTGHHTLFMAALFAAVLSTTTLPAAGIVAIGSVLLGFCMSFFPFIAQGTMRKITESDDIALGHFGTTGYVLAAWVGSFFKKNKKSTEEIEVPQKLMFFRDTTVSISLTMVVLYGVVAIFAYAKFGAGYASERLGSDAGLAVFTITSAIGFAAGIYVVLAGVRLILGEIVPAFEGISAKLVPGVKPALDCPIVFPFAPNAVLIGFVASFAGGLVGLAVCGLAKWTLILPGVIPHFFTGATAGVFANATGGRKGCVAGAFANGLLITFLPILLLPVLGALGFENTTFGDSDFGVVGILLGEVVKFFQ